MTTQMPDASLHPLEMCPASFDGHLCTLAAEHEGAHSDGVTSWPEGRRLTDAQAVARTCAR